MFPRDTSGSHDARLLKVILALCTLTAVPHSPFYHFHQAASSAPDSSYAPSYLPSVASSYTESYVRPLRPLARTAKETLHSRRIFPPNQAPSIAPSYAPSYVRILTVARGASGGHAASTASDRLLAVILALAH